MVSVHTHTHTHTHLPTSPQTDRQTDTSLLKALSFWLCKALIPHQSGIRVSNIRNKDNEKCIYPCQILYDMYICIFKETFRDGHTHQLTCKLQTLGDYDVSRSINCNQRTTLVRAVGNGGSDTCVGTGNTGNLCTFLLICCEPKTSLRKQSLKNQVTNGGLKKPSFKYFRTFTVRNNTRKRIMG